MNLYEFDTQIRNKYGIICGADEAGRGPLAGDVYAAAVILSEGVFFEGLNDSKKLTAQKRDLLFDEITAKADFYCISTATVSEIEELNILNASMLAMKRAIEGLPVAAGIALIDGNKAPEMHCPVQTVVKGDGTSASIAAASILAKVSRDRYMTRMAEKYPQYLFEKHKGYGTKLHYEMLDKYGICDIHRPSFLKKRVKHGLLT